MTTTLAGGDVVVEGTPVGFFEAVGIAVVSLLCQGLVASALIFAGFIPLSADVEVLLSNPVPLLLATVAGQALGVGVAVVWLKVRRSWRSTVRSSTSATSDVSGGPHRGRVGRTNDRSPRPLRTGLNSWRARRPADDNRPL